MSRAEHREAERGRAASSAFPWPSWGDLGAWVIAFAVAIGLWLFVNTGERVSERTIRVRLEARNLPLGLMVTNRIPEHAEVRVSGPGMILSGIEPRRLRVPLDLSGVRAGVATFALGPQMFHLPRKVEVLRVTPAQISFHVERSTRRTLPVRLERQGEVEEGGALGTIEIVPEKVEVVGPATQVDGLRAVTTAPLDLGTLSVGANEVPIPLSEPGDLLQVAPKEVLARIQVVALPVQRELRGVEVAIRGEHAGWTIEPRQVDVVLRGAPRRLEALDLAADSVYVQIQGGAGTGRSRVMVDLPDGIELVRVEPEDVALLAPAPKPSPTPRRRPPARRAERRRE